MKDALYFSHDCNARHDPKCRALRRKFGWAGYGQFWALVEMLRERDSFKIDTSKEYEVETIAEEIGMTPGQVKKFIEFLESKQCELLISKNGVVHAPSLDKRMVIKEQRREQATAAAAKRWGKNADAMRQHSGSNAKKESKEKINKGIKAAIADLNNGKAITSTQYVWLPAGVKELLSAKGDGFIKMLRRKIKIPKEIS